MKSDVHFKLKILFKYTESKNKENDNFAKTNSYAFFKKLKKNWIS